MDKMIINPDMVTFNKTVINENGIKFNEYTSTLTISTKSMIESIYIGIGNINIEDLIKRDHIAEIDNLLYGQYRNMLIQTLMGFMHTMNAYYTGYNYTIPDDVISDIYNKINEIIKGMDEECPNIPTNAELVKMLQKKHYL